MGTRIRLLTFDLDDTLWPSAPVLAHAETTLYRWLQREAPRLGGEWTIETLREHRLGLLERQPELAHEISRWRIVSLREVLQQAGYAAETADELARAAFEVFIEARHAVSYFEDVRPTLERLGRRYTIAGLTNGNADVRRLSVGRHFDFALRAEEVKVSKPEPALFEAALQRAGCRAEQAIHIGDNPAVDIDGARNVGMHALQARLLPDEQNPPAVAASFQSWRELPALIGAIDGD